MALRNAQLTESLQLIDGIGWTEFRKTRLVGRRKRQQLTSASGRIQKIDHGDPLSNIPLLRQSSLVDVAIPASQVSAYCRAVISNVFPHETWGTGLEGERNRETILRNIDLFVGLRRFESLSLHAVSQNLKVRELTIVCDRRLTLRLVKLHYMARAAKSPVCSKSVQTGYGKKKRNPL